MGSIEQEKYIRWDAKGVEYEQEGELDKIWEVSKQFNRLQMMNFNEHMHCLRGTHLKTQGCVIGRFKVNDHLPAHLAQGMFAKGGTYDCIMRYSSLTPKILPDNVPQPRGIGIKVFGVEGEKIWGEDKKTQDFTFNNYPVLELRTPVATCEIADSLERNWNTLDKFGEELSARPDADVATLPARLDRQHLVAMKEWSQSAYRYGDYVAKFGVFPKGEAQKKIEKEYLKDDDPINILSQHARAFHQNHKVTYSFCVQLLENLDDQPVEDIGVEWDEKKYPFHEVAELEFDPQDSWLPEFRVWWDDRITVNGWHGLKSHQPLGSTNRMRRVVYAESRKLRLRVNAHKDYIEPESLTDVPAPIPAIQLPYNPKSGQKAVTSVEISV
ncbi:hypothetical protein DOTSEDRAFT_54448 [Dothistroma septosporum NZE10]|uniref:Catalase core domain-containing protein n=1 Tax=Dothistroma septosporum (strain NZE10 / CBS 128990) TaxID=675120 RepID=N1PHU5_DOTSN|nr:hypothetical protein DOTSEDRAFT_54448 [Dothistroma septosporum NZE10]